MKSIFTREVLLHPLVLGAWGVVVVLAGGSVLYYNSSTVPTATEASVLSPAQSSAIAAQGTVTPAQNPDLFFESSGRVAVVNVAVGQTVRKGRTLAALDTASLSAAREQAAANLKAAQARLDLLNAGPRSVDISAKQTAVAQANQTLANLYTQIAVDLGSAYSNSLGAVHAYTDSLFNSPDTTPTLAFTTSDGQVSTNAGAERATINTLLTDWGRVPATDDPAGLEVNLKEAINRLSELRTYANQLTVAVGEAITGATFTSSSVATANSNLASLRSSTSASVATLQADTQLLASQKLAVQSANDALAQTEAGATTQDIEAGQAAVDAAQANLNAAAAALSNAIITAPFDGTISAVRVKVGDLASPSLPAVSLTPQSALEIDAFLSESEAGVVHAGDSADVTLDAYGASKHFAATVVSVDRAPTVQNGVPAYKAVLEFTQNDPSLAAGMTANLAITPEQH